MITVIISFFYYAGAKLYDAFQGNPPGTFNNTLAVEIPLTLIYYNNITLKQSLPYACNNTNPYYSTTNYSLVPCVEAFKINETIKNTCIQDQELIEKIIIQRRDYSKLQLGWVSMTDNQIFKINDCLKLIPVNNTV